MPSISTSGFHNTSLGGNYQSAGLLNFVLKELVQEPPRFQSIREQTLRQGLPPIQIGPLEGKILQSLARAAGAKKAVEVGTLGGYSAAWIASALPATGKLYSLELDPFNAQVAVQNIKNAGLSGRVKILTGPALDSLKNLSSKGPFDFVFIDADKLNYAHYLRWAVRHLKSGGIAAGDNAFLFGNLHLNPAQAGTEAASVRGMQEFIRLLADPKYFSSCSMIPTGEGLAVGIRK